jgi:hypothetical protein
VDLPNGKPLPDGRGSFPSVYMRLPCPLQRIARIRLDCRAAPARMFPDSWQACGQKLEVDYRTSPPGGVGEVLYLFFAPRLDETIACAKITGYSSMCRKGPPRGADRRQAAFLSGQAANFIDRPNATTCSPRRGRDVSGQAVSMALCRIAPNAPSAGSRTLTCKRSDRNASPASAALAPKCGSP